jgi:nucleoside-diphosphate-sugar epimerase
MVTGASGFIGGRSLPRLLERGYEIHAVSTRAQPDSEGVRWHRADLLAPGAAASLMATVRPTHLLHFAWHAEPGAYWRSVRNFQWLESSLSLLRHFREAGGGRAVVAGTCAEYDWSASSPLSEASSPRRPATPYGVCKNALQEAMHAYCEVEGLSGAWGRIFYLHGPGEHPSRLLPSVVRALLAGGEARCTHGKQVRDYLHVDDVAGAFASLLDSDVAGPVNVASGQPVTLREVVLAAADCLGARERVRFGALPAPQGEPAAIVADVRRLSEEVGWRPERDLAGGIADTVRYWRERTVAA